VKFGIAMEIDSEAERNARAVQKFADHLAEAVDQDYGDDLQNFTVGVICIRSRPGYEAWYTPRPPQFESREIVSLLDGTSEEVVNSFGYDIRLTDDEYNSFVSVSPRSGVELISAKLTQSLANLDALPASVENFDRRRFEADFERFSQAALGGI
jgi:hypothetical protein